MWCKYSGQERVTFPRIEVESVKKRVFFRKTRYDYDGTRLKEGEKVLKMLKGNKLNNSFEDFVASLKM